MGSDILVPVALFLAAHTGALIYYAGAVRQTLKFHGDVIARHEIECKECGKAITILQAKVGVL
jgi:hypothetical protein